MNLKDRIKNENSNGQPSACAFVDLNDAEAKLYRGCGLKYAAVKNGEIVEARDCVSDSIGQPAPSIVLKACNRTRWCATAARKEREMIAENRKAEYEAARAWKRQKAAEGCEVWKGVFSCYQFCRPVLKEVAA